MSLQRKHNLIVSAVLTVFYSLFSKQGLDALLQPVYRVKSRPGIRPCLSPKEHHGGQLQSVLIRPTPHLSGKTWGGGAG